MKVPAETGFTSQEVHWRACAHMVEDRERHDKEGGAIITRKGKAGGDPSICSGWLMKGEETNGWNVKMRKALLPFWMC